MKVGPEQEPEAKEQPEDDGAVEKPVSGGVKKSLTFSVQQESSATGRDQRRGTIASMEEEPRGLIENIHALPTPFLTSVRFRLALLTCFGFFVMYGQRVNLSITMVCMVKTVSHDSNHTTMTNMTEDSCGTLQKSSHKGGDLEWDKHLQGMLLGAFFYGYLIMQIPGGLLAQKMGAKGVILAGMVPVAAMTMLSPEIARRSANVFFAVRVIIGLGQGVMYPAAMALWGAWSPPKERTQLVAISLSGGQLGNAFIFPMGGILCDEVGWDSVFYFIGTLGTIFCVIWTLWVKSTPKMSRGLSDEERRYLYATIQTTESKPDKIPWKDMFTSVPVWAVLIAHTCGNYSYYMNLTMTPTYMKDVLKFDLKANGAFSMLPYLIFWFTTFATGLFSDWLILHGNRAVVVRKIFAAIGLLGPAASLIATSFVTCKTKYWAVFTLCMAGGFTGFGFSSYMVNHGDLAPHFAGTLFGISNTLATFPGIVAPSIVGSITADGTPEQWQKAFAIAAVLNVFGAVIFLLFGSAEIQQWATDEPSVHLEGKMLNKPIRRVSVALASH